MYGLKLEKRIKRVIESSIRGVDINLCRFFGQNLFMHSFDTLLFYQFPMALDIETDTDTGPMIYCIDCTGVMDGV